MFDKKINFPTDLIQELAIKYLDPKSVLSASKVSKSWNSLFTHPTIWKNKITHDFGIDTKLLSELQISEDKQFLYQQMYTRLYTGAKHRTLPNFIKTIYKDKTYQNLLLLACLDNITAFYNVTAEERYSLAVLSIYMGGFHLPVYFDCNFLQNQIAHTFLKEPNWEKLIQSFLYHSVTSGNLQLVQHLLLKNPWLKPDEWTLNYAAESGNLQLVQWLLNPENLFGLKPNLYTLKFATESGNLQLVQYLLNPENKFELETLHYILDFAARSGNLQLVQYLSNSENQFKPNQNTLDNAAESGNLHLVQWLLNPQKLFGLKPNQNTIDVAAQSGNLQLMQYLSNSENQFGLQPNQDTLDNAAKSGNLHLVQWLLNPKKSFGLKPNQNTIDVAARSGNLQLMQYLLNPENQFGLKPNQDTLNWAAFSGCHHLVLYLLHPSNQFGLEPDQATITKANESGNFGLSKYLLPSHINMQVALQKLQKNNFNLAKGILHQSHMDSPSHYKLWSDYVLKNAKQFNLNDEAIRLLEDQENNSSMFDYMYKK